MPLTRLVAQGYRTLKEIDWQPGNLNVIIGPNGSGKSNLLKLLRLISLSAQGRLHDHILSEGGIQQLLWNGQSGKITFELFQEIEIIPFHYALDLSPVGQSSNFLITYEHFDKLKWIGTVTDWIITHSYLARPKDIAWVDDGSYHVDFNPGDFKQDESLLSQIVGPTLKADDVRLFHKSMSSWAIYDDLHTDRASEIRRATTARYEELLDADGQNLVPVLHTHYTSDADFKETIDSAMTAAFGDEYQELVFPPAADQQVQLRIRWKSLKRPQSAAALSDGTLRFLAIITALAQPNPPALIAIDEPETGLHPSMLRLIAECAEDAALRTQVLFTTHSAAFLSGFSQEEPPTTTVMELHGEVSTMKVVDPETLRRWLTDFTLGDLYRTHELEQMPTALREMALSTGAEPIP